MMMVEFQFCLHIFVCLVVCVQAVQQLRTSKTILNSKFLNKRILEAEIINTKANHALVCAYICTDTRTCLSFGFNKLTQTCVLFDKDFTDVNSTQTATEDGWDYYYIVRDYEEKRNPCFAPAVDELCSFFCLRFVKVGGNFSYSSLMMVCQWLGGEELVKVDRGLKQYCVKHYCVEKNSGIYPVLIQGRRNETTNKWNYDEGTEITYFNWDTANGQPSNATGDTVIGIFPESGYMWHAIYDRFISAIYGIVCQLP